MKIRIILLLALFTTGISTAFAHALWIETSSTGKKGAPQTVKVFFGEYEEKPDSTAKWFSNMSKFSLVLTAPNGETKILDSKADVSFYAATFTPDQDGVYRLSVVHEVAEIYDNAKIEYYAFADVAVGKATTLNSNYPKAAQLSFRPRQTWAKANGDASYDIKLNNKSFVAQKITIVNPDRKKQEQETDSNGQITIKPVQKGSYFLEAFYEDKTAGSLGDKKFEKTWHVATYFTKVD